jgi:murein DD-endopeptidase MepM/ murein hydrolase activator NlpD
MPASSSPLHQPLRALLSAGGALALALVFIRDPGADAPEIGRIAAVMATPAERVDIHALQRGQTLGTLLGRSVDPAHQQEMLVAFQEQADTRRMQVGTEVTLRFRSKDQWLRGVDVELNPDSTVRMTRDDFGWHSETVVTPLWTDTVYAGGMIEGSLWTSIVGNPELLKSIAARDLATLTGDLDKVFESQVDFSTQIQRGDNYRIAVERKVRPDGSMKSDRILAAQIVAGGKPLHAIWFDAEGTGQGSYYDLDGKSLRLAFLTKPVEFRYISSRFTSARKHPVLGTWRAHKGVDYAASTGTPIRATADGTIVRRGVNGGYGNFVEVRHGKGLTTRYGHMSRFAPGQAVGGRVKQGDVIGYVGMTGLATGPHLHYEVLKNGVQINPLSANAGSGTGDPVPPTARERWNTELVGRLDLLEAVPALGSTRYAAQVPAAPNADAAASATRANGGR